tara:strand:- start:413 stop:1462 length:1050 start_codon:yes stop_codon:yes gene_type:complete
MNIIKNNNLSEDNILTSFNFARKSDLVFSETIEKDEYKKLKNLNDKIIFSDSKKVFYKLNTYELKENQIIFCNNYLLENLFYSLKNCKFKNIKLITHQTDLSINKKLFRKKPNCISDWFSINTNYKNKNLFPIPIGLSNNYSPKNLNFYDYQNIHSIPFIKKENKVYVNFNKNTNFKKRSNLYNQFLNNEWFDVDEPNLPLNLYIQKLNNYKYILCPEGNGVDTHRIWESLYLGSIPIVKRHKNFQSFEDLPIFQVDDFNEINMNSLETFSKNLDVEVNYKKLTINHWIEFINSKKISSKNLTFKYVESDYITNYYINNFLYKEKFKSRMKKVQYFFRRLRKLLLPVKK